VPLQVLKDLAIKKDLAVPLHGLKDLAVPFQGLKDLAVYKD
jgi:hypothetical protein